MGTVLLATFTGALAWTTSREVSATRQLAEEAQQDRRLRDKPDVVVVSVGNEAFAPKGDGSAAQAIYRATVQNVGLGPAIRLNVRLIYAGFNEITTINGEAVLATLMPGETSETPRFFFEAPMDTRLEQYPDEDFRVEGDYQDRRMAESFPIIDPRESFPIIDPRA
jgi:hypothetical protein